MFQISVWLKRRKAEILTKSNFYGKAAYAIFITKVSVKKFIKRALTMRLYFLKCKLTLV